MLDMLASSIETLRSTLCKFLFQDDVSFALEVARYVKSVKYARLKEGREVERMAA